MWVIIGLTLAAALITVTVLFAVAKIESEKEK